MKTISIQEQVRRFLDLLAAIGRRNCLRDPIATAMENQGISHAQMHALLWLRLDAPLAMHVLAQRVGASTKTVTGLVDRLERDGYTQRERDRADRRLVQVVLTQKGKKLAAAIHREIGTRIGLFLGILDGRDRKDMFRILENVVARVEAKATAARKGDL